MSKHIVTVVPHTHWDREWYQPFSVFQARLVETVDAVLDLLDRDPRFTHFMLDGQAVILDDYLALEPAAETRIRERVSSGRLAIGPWYTLPDEFLSSPEALVRNLLIGGEVCRRFGEPMPVVYTPDSFGHVSQLPLLAHEFGFDSLVFERGVGDEGEEIGGEFRWRTADGRNAVLAVHLLTTYSSGAGIGYRDWNRYHGFDAERAEAHARKALYGSSEPIGMESWLDESLARIPGGSSAYTSGAHLLLLNGSDHLLPQTDLPDVIELLNERIGDADFRLGRLREYMDGVIAEAGDLNEYQGEFRGSRYHHVLSGVFSARLYLKQANHAAQQTIERYAEPLSALAYGMGAPYPAAVLEGAWKDLLRNHCHDSICGCSIDAVHDEMMPRFAGVIAAGSYVGRKAFAHLSGGFWQMAPLPVIGSRLTPPPSSAVRRPHDDDWEPATADGDSKPTPDALASPEDHSSPVGAVGSEPALLTVFNPHPRRWEGVLEAELPVADGWRPDGLSDLAGTRLPATQRVSSRQVPGDARRQETLIETRWFARLEPLSVTSFRLLRNEGTQGAPGSGDERRYLQAKAGRLENDLIAVNVGADGLLLEHKETGERVKARLYLEDVADAGDEYDFSPLAGDDPIEYELNGFELHEPEGDFLRASMRLTGELRLPARLSPDRQRREGEVLLPFEVELDLAAGDPFVKLEVRLENRAEDHRLRLRIDSDVENDRVTVEGHFDVLERPLEPPTAEGWFQKPSGSNHQRRFLAVEDGRRGLAVFNAGLPEYSAEALADGVGLSVTLLRSVGWLSRNDLTSRPEGAGPALPTPGAQCLGEHSFELALMPFSGGWDDAGVPDAAERFTTPPWVEATAGEASGLGLLELPDGLLLSAVKKAAATPEVVVRFWNPGRKRVDGMLRLAQVPESLRLVDMSESTQRELAPQATLPLSVEPKQVVTLAFTPAFAMATEADRSGGDAMG